MTEFLDKTFPPNLKLARKYEGLILDALELLPKDSEPARVAAIEFIAEFDELLMSRLDVDKFMTSDQLGKADTYLRSCTLDKFWGLGLPRLKQVRHEIWESISGT